MSGAFDYKTATDSSPIGTVVESPINLEVTSGGKYLALDGRYMFRQDYPDLAKHFAAGKFTQTARTLNATPATTIQPAVDNTNFLLGGASGTSPLQASADGITWSTSATWSASTRINSLIRAGSRFVAAGSTGDMSAPYVAAIDQTAANIVAKSNWTATTGGTTVTNGLAHALAYSSSLGLTVMCGAGTGTSIYTLADGATAWSTRTHTSSVDKTAVVWTGMKFIAFTSTINLIITSTDGVTWTESYADGALNVNPTHVASNENGVIVALPYTTDDFSKFMVVSTDHGVTWRRIAMPSDVAYTWLTGQVIAYTTYPRISYTNGKFFVVANLYTNRLVSSDGVTWTSMIVGASGVTASANHFAYKAGVYLGVQDSTAALTATEDLSYFRLPTPAGKQVSSNTAGGDYSTHYQLFIKAKL